MRRIIVLLAAAVMISGCATARYRVETNGYFDAERNNQGSLAGSSFFVVPNRNAENRIFDKEIKAKIEKLLIREGCSIRSEDEAQYFLTYSYAVDGGETKIGDAPVYNPGQTTYTSGTVSGSGGTVSYSGTSQTLGYTTYVPRSYTVYRRTLRTKVTDSGSYKSSGDKEPIWLGDTVSVGGNNDLRGIMDYLLLSNFKYFGENTRKAMSDSFSEKGEDARELRGETGLSSGRSKR